MLEYRGNRCFGGFTDASRIAFLVDYSLMEFQGHDTRDSRNNRDDRDCSGEYLKIPLKGVPECSVRL
jgi:hypothetical protein